MVAYRQQYGDCLVPQRYSDKQLANWVWGQRGLKKTDKLEAARVQRLDELEFSWDPKDESWEEMFDRLAQYKQKHGDCLVPRGYSDKKLNGWVKTQRTLRNSGKLEAARVQRLEGFGFVWDPHGESWEKMFGRLVAYKQKHGDCLVTSTYGDKKLGAWVHVQRRSKNSGKLEATRVQRLEELGFMWAVRDSEPPFFPMRGD